MIRGNLVLRSKSKNGLKLREKESLTEDIIESKGHRTDMRERSVRLVMGTRK